MMPNSDPRDRFVCPNLTQMIDPDQNLGYTCIFSSGMQEKVCIRYLMIIRENFAYFFIKTNVVIRIA